MVGQGEVEDFISVTGASSEAAERVIELCGGDLGQAISLWFSDEDLQRALVAPPVPETGPDAQGVIHINSDDDGDDALMTDNDSLDAYESDGTAGAANIARTAQEEEDAAMAKRLQEELYSGGAGGAAAADDGVRAPMARITETLIDAGASYVVDDDDDDHMHDALLEQMRRRRREQAARPNPFAQSMWENGSSASSASPAIGSGNSRATRLAELFRPPYDLISHMGWDEARDKGKDEKKWILVNLQDMADFNCQALNRDIWKDETVRSLVTENFIFLQYETNDPIAGQYISFYFPNQSHENPNNYPHVSIIDPRTGEQVKVWSGIPFPNPADFQSQLMEFLERYSLAANSKNPVSKAKRPERVVDVDRMTEEEMLELAMQNSLANGGPSVPDVIDPDELTKSGRDASSDKGKERAGSESLSATPEPQQSAFARIPSGRPHVEPQADPKTTTRIQVRNPPQRIIRRFRLDEPVSRIYEWLKAEPLEGKEGVEFELKSMPQGADLIEQLDKTIQEAGLANATVMIEFITE
ncbi:hypothetical protein B0T26DRAFT_737191 [Lasiosphaeria miniovina]|uniref:UBX domain-containing protein n=1 Tax=Lasiosphaeria miniovina TaxID=1954250 RepID=A0AA40EC52_9PEZI|nr:uncharacterized protein B0T26DRAFT_737191 [Lasiosphaeria miniovina]KAK0734555.1 hypothetical protein B0T26DRAFT_737191 [Lasiosphaeria miniovina]